MPNKTVPMTDSLYDYAVATWVKEPPILAELREETAPMERAGMQISPDQGRLMNVLTKAIGAKRALEIGVFTGYSSLSVASALPDDGEFVACDVSAEFTSMARKYWAKAGLDNKIELILQPAVRTLATLLETKGPGYFDIAFIDADKPGYPDYFDYCCRLVRKGGIILVDNVLWSGKVADPNVTDDDTVAMRNFNQSVARDPRVEIALIPIADGLTICYVK